MIFLRTHIRQHLLVSLSGSKKVLSCLFLLSLIFTSCFFDENVYLVDKGEDATIRVQIQDLGSISSKVPSYSGVQMRAFSDVSIADIHVLVYNSVGELTGHSYSSGNATTVSTRSGNGCTIYAIANTGEEHLFDGGVATTLTSLRDMITNDIASIDGVKINENLLMTGSIQFDILPGSNIVTETFLVSRLAARNNFVITCSEGAKLTGYSINSLPVKSYYIARPNTNEALGSDILVGDDAVHTTIGSDWFDSGTISTGEVSSYNLTFYMYENRRGGRVEVGGITGDDSDQTQKEIYAPEHATYLELNAKIGSYTTTYKLYLGADKFKNYNIKRNCSYKYNITIGSGGTLTVTDISIDPWEVINGGESNL